MDSGGWCLHGAPHAHVYDRDAVAITRRGIIVVMYRRPLDWRTSTTGEMLRR